MKSTLPVCCLLINSVIAVGQSGTLDQTFDALVPYGVCREAQAMVIQDDDKVLIIGTKEGAPSQDIAITRFAIDGALDTSFSGDGVDTLDISNGSNDEAFAIALQSNGKIVATGGSTDSTGMDLLLTRWNEDGTLDIGFGSNGITLYGAGLDSLEGQDVEVLSDGRLLVLARACNASDCDMAVLRFHADGNLDSTFGTGGQTLTDLLPGDEPVALAVASDGRLIVATKDLLLGYDTAGFLDVTFGTLGIVDSLGLYNQGYPGSLTLQADGKILVAGKVDFVWDMGVARYYSDGSVDTAFGLNGLASMDLGLAYEMGSAVAVQSDGKVLLAGAGIVSVFPTSAGFAMIRFDDNGQVDASFGSSGAIAYMNTYSGATSIGFQSDEKILLAGESLYYAAPVARYGNAISLGDLSTVQTTSPASSIHVYPCPAEDGIVVECDLLQVEGTECRLFSVAGELIFVKPVLQTGLQDKGARFSMDTSSLAAGVYTLVVENEGVRVCTRVIKQ